MIQNPITSDVHFERDGVQHGYLRLPHSRDDSAWGSIPIPITVIKNEDGPTALLSGANHGDEFEGPVALFDLARTLAVPEVSGRVIIVPAMNYPAFRASTRTSPIDGGNLNRSFPGRPDGTITEKIADFFSRTLLPLADVVVDIHSGGKTLAFVPFAASHELGDQEHQARCATAAVAFAAPYTLRMRELDTVGLYDTTAESLGKTFVTTELGGGGSASARTISIARRGVRNVLKHAGILAGPLESAVSIQLDMPGDECFTFADIPGLIEFCIELGAEVRTGDLVARTHDITRTGAAPLEHHAQLDGILAARHFPGLIQSGDCMAVIATLVKGD